MLNPSQELAKNTIDWPLLIIAWAWSWKTSTLTARIEHMIKHVWIDPNSILAVTFTNKASQEMKHRFWKILNRHYAKSIFQNRWLPTVGTFHSIWVLILKEKIETIWYNKDFIIYDEQDKMSIIKSIIRDDLALDDKKYIPRAIATYISNAKNTCISPSKYKSKIDSHIHEIVSKVYDLYEEKLNKNNSLDFDDILLKTLDILKIDSNLEYYQEKFKYIMVDEYQDTNMVQYDIVKLLASKYRNLAVVWDDWQSIYSFRWADMRNILNFNKDYPEALIIKLEQNYRSTKTIVWRANSIIKLNKTAIDKTLFTDNDIWDKITYIQAIDDRQESSIVSNIIKELWPPYSQNLILYRTNWQSRQLEEYLMSNTIPYKIIWWLKFYDRKEIKDILSYLKVIHNPNDELWIKRIINVPSRKIWDKTVSVIEESKVSFWLNFIEVIENIDEVDDLNSWTKRSVSNFYSIIKDLIDASNSKEVIDLISYIIEKIWYEEYLQQEYTKEEVEWRLDNIKELKNLASNYSWLTPRESLSMFLEEVSLLTDNEDKKEESDFVSLMTVHTSKWLEYDNVFICWLEESIFPHSRSLNEAKELEEERRLMYVALTRAKKRLYISRAMSRYTFWDYASNLESRFIQEIPKEYIENYENTKSNFSFSSWFDIPSSGSIKIKKSVIKNDIWDFNIWDKVNHHKFWDWIIRSLNWNIAEVYFDLSWSKKMNIELAPISKI